MSARTQDTTTTQGGPYPPSVYLGGAIFTIFTNDGAAGLDCPAGLLLSGPPEPPHCMAHTLRGSHLNCPWPTGTHVLEVKE